MYKFSLFTNHYMTPEGVVFNPEFEYPMYLEYLDWVALGNTVEEVASFPGEIEAYEKRTAIFYEANRGDGRITLGKTIYNEIMAAIAYDESHGEIELSDFQSMQEDLDIVSNWLFKGQLKKALFVFQQASFSQVFRDRYYALAEQRMNKDISESYPPIEYARQSAEDIGGGGIKNPKP